MLCPPAIRPAVVAIYHFARTADDIADEGDAPPAQRLADLQAYLRQRGQDATPGLANGVMHLASVVTPQAPPERRRVVVQALQAWARTMGFGAYQVKWQLWELQGPSSDWPLVVMAKPCPCGASAPRTSFSPAAG